MTDAELRKYRSLIYKTATLIVGSVEGEFDDIVQTLAIKAWRAHDSFDPARFPGERVDELGRSPRDRYVYFCIRNAVIDLQRKRRRPEVSLEGVKESRFQSRDSFDVWAGLVSESDVELAHLDAEDLSLPNTLDQQERTVVGLLYAGRSQGEVRALLGIGVRPMEKVMRLIRVKLADWKPASPPAPSQDGLLRDSSPAHDGRLEERDLVEAEGLVPVHDLDAPRHTVDALDRAA